MSQLESYADSLAQEALLDAAESFFGSRRSIEDEVEFFCDKVKVVQELCDTAMERAHGLHALLLDTETAHEFYYTLGVRPGRLMVWADPAKARPLYRLPWALTRAGRYAKLVLKYYAAFQDAADIYMNGRYYTDPRAGGRKRLSLHYHLMRDWAGHINRRIRKVNEDHAPSCVINFARGMDPSKLANERLTEATLENYACKLDEDLAIPLVDCMALDLKELPDLPPPDDVKKKVLAYGKRVYKERKDEAEEALRLLHKPKPS